MARRGRRWLLAFTILFLLLGTFVLVARLMRGSASPPEAVGRITRERNLFTDLYAARAGGGIILFDAGVDPAGGALDRLLGSFPATRDDVREVFLSHGHFDHVAAAPVCKKAKIRVGAPDVEFMAQRAPMIAPVAGKLLNAVFPVPPVYATDPLIGRVEISVGDDKVLAIPTPGHTPGSYVFVFDGVLFAGDSMVIDGDKLGFCMSGFSVDPPLNHQSIAALADALAGVDVQTVCTGHMGCTPPGKGKQMLADLIARGKK